MLLVEVHVPPTLIPQPTRIQSAGNKPKLVDEYIGRVNSNTGTASVAAYASGDVDVKYLPASCRTAG